MTGPKRTWPLKQLKQTAVFFLTVIVPSFALVLLSARMITQERELAANRSRERRETLGREFGAALFRWLNEAVESGTNAAIALSGVIDNGRLRLPWERGDKEPISGEAGEFTQALAAAERAEFAASDPGSALEKYRAALALAGSPREKAAARLALARVLWKREASEEAVAEWRELLALPLSVRDASDVPFAFYAAGRLLQNRVESASVWPVLVRVVEAASSLSSPALYMLREYFEQMRGEHPEGNEAVEAARIRLEGVVARNEQWTLLRDKLTALNVRLLEEREESPDPAVWRWQEDERPLLLTRVAARENSVPRLVAVDPAPAIGFLRGERAFNVFRDSNPEISGGAHPRGVPLGDSFGPMQLVLPEAVFAALAIRPQIGIYASIIVLVVGITLYGAYLWTLNTRRETHLAQMRSDFVASVSHELKTPLTSIQMLTETLRRRPLEPAERTEYLDLIFQETQRLGRLLKNVLDFSKVEQGSRTYDLVALNLRDIVELARRTAEQPMREKNIDFVVVNELDIELMADADALEQALLNLLYNALKYSPDHSAIELRTDCVKGQAVISVTDQGIGIPAREHERIFERFYRVPEEHNRRIAGTGLGLALVKHIAEGHGGRVTVRSAPGAGSTFCICLPIRQS